jgi:hypothetical protein
MNPPKKSWPSGSSALLALNTLRQYEEQNSGDLDVLKVLRRRESELLDTQLSAKRQVQLDMWLSG